MKSLPHKLTRTKTSVRLGTWALDYSQNPELMAALFCVR